MNEPVISKEPINGSVVDYDWVDDGVVIVEVHDGDETWFETYEFVEAEKSS